MPDKNNRVELLQTQEPARRLAIKQMAAALGLSLSTSALNSLANSEPTPTTAALKLFSKTQHQLVGVIAELIIPATDTLGALGVGAHNFLDQYLAECTTKEEQTKLLKGLDRIERISQKEFNKAFVTLTTTQQTTLLTKLDNSESPFTKADYDFFIQFKSLTLFAYYTSEVGASKELAYLAIPGGYKGNFPFSKIGKAWSLN